MNDLIKRADAIKAIAESVYEELPYLETMDECVFYAERLLEDIPSADAIPRAYHDKVCECMYARHREQLKAVEPKQGEWIYCEDDEGQDGYRCSECGFFVPWYYGYEDINYIYKYHACPSCTARMKGADDE